MRLVLDFHQFIRLFLVRFPRLCLLLQFLLDVQGLKENRQKCRMSICVNFKLVPKISLLYISSPRSSYKVYLICKVSVHILSRNPGFLALKTVLGS